MPFIKTGVLNVFYFVIKKSEISNSFFVTTKALYRNFPFDISKISEDSYRIVTDDKVAFESLSLELYDRGVYHKIISKDAIEKIWEERTKSNYNFPFPVTLSPIEEISLKTI
ncbi:hypothetical protein CNR22_12015 [Sphingobacteriaceae bacterium]|nr:hypothetical protein CNR22_12015 [Sphingobacteriaceae bacterium]